MKKQILLFFCNNHKTLSYLEYILNADFNRIGRKVLKLGNIIGYHIAGSTRGHYEVNPALPLATRAGKMSPSCTFPL